MKKNLKKEFLNFFRVQAEKRPFFCLVDSDDILRLHRNSHNTNNSNLQWLVTRLCAEGQPRNTLENKMP